MWYHLQRVALLLCIAFAATSSRASERGVPASEGIGNFGKVNDSLYRGAQPDEAGIKSLKALGVKTIINLRTTKDAIAAEATQAGANGIFYTNISLAGMG